MTTTRLLAAILVASAIPLAASSLSGQEKKPVRTLGIIERNDPRFDKLIAPGATLEILAGGFDWAEGPVWVSRDGGYLLCSDIPKNSIIKWQEGKGKSVFLKPSGYLGSEDRLREPGSNGLTLDSEGRLVACDHGERRVYRLEKDNKTKTTLADRYQGKRFNSPNDLAYKSNGDLYFTDPPYGLMVKGSEGFPGRELDFCGVYRLAKNGTLTLLTKEMSRPNGIAFSPDEKTLYVANSDPEKAVWMAFEVKDDGTLGQGRVFFDATKWVATKKGLPDGMKVDRDGNLFATGPGGVLVFAPDGHHLGTIATGVPTANCAWGNDGSVLYVTADKDLCRIKTLTSGRKP
ncbi:MAG TPA: SMP-30/gluconolactonase/LRE family protein [Gemmataceae bacterium]|nr:SMP-30/gluconolactonase/LRE family protein [Gemmataceae bacterium]